MRTPLGDRNQLSREVAGLVHPAKKDLEASSQKSEKGGSHFWLLDPVF
jgi:hypothetical protein